MAYVWSSSWVKGIWETSRDLQTDPGVMWFDPFTGVTDVGSGTLWNFGTQNLRFASVHNWYDMETAWGVLANGTVTLKIEDATFTEIATIGADTAWTIDVDDYVHGAAAAENPNEPIPPYKDVPEFWWLEESTRTSGSPILLGASPDDLSWGLVHADDVGTIEKVQFYAVVEVSFYVPRYTFYGKNYVRFYGDADPQSDDTRRYYSIFRTVVDVTFSFLPAAGESEFIGAGPDDQYQMSPHRKYDTVWLTGDSYDEEIEMDVVSGIPTDYKMNEATSTLIRAAMPHVEGGPPLLRRIGSAADPTVQSILYVESIDMGGKYFLRRRSALNDDDHDRCFPPMDAAQMEFFKRFNSQLIPLL